MVLAALFTAIWGSFEDAAAMGGATVGGFAGIAIGLGLGIWLVLRKDGAHAGKALAWVAAVAFLVAILIAIVVFSY